MKTSRSAQTCWLVLSTLLCLCLIPACKSSKVVPGTPDATLVQTIEEEEGPPLADILAPHLAELGSRNWVVIADPTYPIFSGQGVKTITVSASIADCFREVLDVLEAQGSLVPRIWVDSELEVVSEDRAPGMGQHRKSVEELLAGRMHYRVPERQVAKQIEVAGKTYRVLVIKTKTQLPYSTLAIELDSGYWSHDAEDEVRRRLEELNKTTQAPAEKEAQLAHSTPR